MSEVKTLIGKMGSTNPINIAFCQEIDRLQAIIQVVTKTLSDLQLAIAGTIILSLNLIDAMNALFDARVPPSWLAKSWEAPTLGVWFPSLIARFEQWDKWLRNGRPKSFWLTGFFNGQGFLTGMRQEITRKHSGWALDDVVVFTQVTKLEPEDVKESPSEGIYIHGLFMDGCAWSKKENKLIDAPPKVLFTNLPVLFVTGMLKHQAKVDYSTYNCPVYKVKKRTDLNWVFTVQLKIDEKSQKWILRGAALLCSKD